MFNIKKIFTIIFIIELLITTPVYAKDKLNAIVNINQEFSLSEIPDEIEFITVKNISADDYSIPADSVITAEVLEAQKERRWHKSGFIVLKAKYYETKNSEKINLENKNLYLIARKYEKIKGKDVAIHGTETVLSLAASFFVPGIDIAYFFTKGAITKEKNPNWFKSGVSNAYDNSIFWFWLKGKPIELEEDETVKLKEIKEKRAYKLKSQIQRRKMKKKLIN